MKVTICLTVFNAICCFFINSNQSQIHVQQLVLHQSQSSGRWFCCAWQVVLYLQEHIHLHTLWCHLVRVWAASMNNRDEGSAKTTHFTQQCQCMKLQSIFVSDNISMYGLQCYTRNQNAHITRVVGFRSTRVLCRIAIAGCYYNYMLMLIVCMAFRHQVILTCLIYATLAKFMQMSPNN